MSFLAVFVCYKHEYWKFKMCRIIKKLELKSIHVQLTPGSCA